MRFADVENRSRRSYLLRGVARRFAGVAPTFLVRFAAGFFAGLWEDPLEATGGFFVTRWDFAGGGGAALCETEYQSVRPWRSGTLRTSGLSRFPYTRSHFSKPPSPPFVSPFSKYETAKRLSIDSRNTCCTAAITSHRFALAPESRDLQRPAAIRGGVAAFVDDKAVAAPRNGSQPHR